MQRRGADKTKPTLPPAPAEAVRELYTVANAPELYSAARGCPLSTLFISDLHLGAQDAQRTQAAVDFLRHQTSGVETLYILGDLFDAWLGDDDPAPYAAELLEELRRISRAGAALFFMHGNRDFLLGADFCARCGGRLLPDHHRVRLHGEAVLLMHGDSLCTLDQDYLALRKRLRTTRWQKDFLGQPLEERRRIATQLRAASRAANDQKSEQITDVSPQAVADIMCRYRVRTLVHGHTHRPYMHQFLLQGAPARRIVLGDWHSHGWFLHWDAAGPRLKRLPLPPT